VERLGGEREVEEEVSEERPTFGRSRPQCAPERRIKEEQLS
jgi:hypothetical protein